jgi:hypothetical protein
MKLKLSVWLTLVTSLAAAQLASDQAANPEATYSLTGTVENSVTGEPIPHALVQIVAGSEQNTFSDAGGRFEFDHLSAGMTTSVLARKPGFLNPGEIESNPSQGSVNYCSTDGKPCNVNYSAAQTMVKIGPDAAPVTIHLIPEGVVFGRAQKPDGEPIGYLTVQLFHSEISQGRKRWDLMNSTQTNEDGEFRIAGLAPGSYYLLVGPRFQTTWIGIPAQRAREAAYRPMFYPGVSDLASAAPVEVSAGQQVEADLSLSPDPVFRLSGSVVGLPPDEAVEIWHRVQLISRSNDLVAMPVEEPGNSFQAKVPAGSYVLRAYLDTPQGSFRGDVPVNVQSDLAGVTLAVAPSAPLRAELTIEHTQEPSVREGRGVEGVNLRFLAGGMRLPSTEINFRVSPGAINNINGVDPGVYAVEITPNTPDDLYVDSAQCGGTDLLRQSLAVGQELTAPIRIALRDDGGRLSGNVVSDGRNAGEATVLVISDRAPKQIRSVMAAGNGQFQSPKLAPGDYSVLAFDSVAGIEYTNPEVMNAYSSNATRVSVSSNGESRITVNLLRTAKR